MAIQLSDIKRDEEVETYLECGTDYLGTMGFTEHGRRHASLVAHRARDVLAALGYGGRDCELAAIAGYLHDLGNMVNRFNHGGTGALMVYQILSRLGMEPREIGLVISAIGNHEEERGNAVNHVASALILADKSDVHRGRVTNREFATFDIHDRVNYAAERSVLNVDRAAKTIKLELSINTEICPVMEYFEIFLERMIMCRRAAEFLHCRFGLVINDNPLL